MPENRAQRRMRQAGERRQVFVPPAHAWWTGRATVSTDSTTTTIESTTNANTNHLIWTSGGGLSLASVIYYYGNAQYVAPVQAPPPLTAEDAERITREREARRIERARAIDRSELLLQESLSPQQLSMLRDRNYFEVATIDKQGAPRLFRLSRGRVANILEINVQQLPIRRYCVHPSIDCPEADTLLAQKLWLENSPDELLAIANRHPI